MAYKKTINEEARKVYERALALYLINPTVPFTEILKLVLQPYNNKMATLITEEVLDMTGTGVSAGAILSAGMMKPPTLSKRLYQNGKQAAKDIRKVMDEHLQQQSTIYAMEKALYDGYDYDELIQFKKDLPRYLTRDLDAAKVASLKTKSLKASYMAVINARSDEEFKKALKVASEEKARFYARRIAMTEESRAYNLANIQRMIDQGIEFVTWTLSGSHKTPCICDMFANQNVGYGRGVYPLKSAPVPVTSSHPYCRCVLRKVFMPPNKVNTAKNPTNAILNQMNLTQQRAVLGSHANVKKWKAGKSAYSLINSGRPPQYRVQTVGQVFSI